MSKTGGGIGTNQYQIRCHPQVPLPDPRCPSEAEPLLGLDSYDRARIAADPHTPAAVLIALKSDTKRDVLVALAGNPASPPTVLESVILTTDTSVRSAIAHNPATSSGNLHSLIAEYLNLLDENLRISQAGPEHKLYRDLGHRYYGSALSPGNNIETVRAAARNPNCPISTLESLAASPLPNVILAILDNPNTPIHLWYGAAANQNVEIRHTVAAHQSCPSGVLAILSRDTTLLVRRYVAAHISTPPTTLVNMLAQAEPELIPAILANPNCPSHLRVVGSLGRSN